MEMKCRSVGPSNECSHGGNLSAHAKPKALINCAVTAQLISACVFAAWIVQSLYYLNPKFQVSRCFLRLYRLICARTLSETQTVGFLMRWLNLLGTWQWSAPGEAVTLSRSLREAYV